MEERTLPTYRVLIFVGFRVTKEDTVFMPSRVQRVLREFTSLHRVCVTMSPTEYVYVDGDEPGAVIGLINYPRFPRTIEEIDVLAMALAKELKQTLRQERVSIMFPDRTITIGSF